jgi:hypothetical protein
MRFANPVFDRSVRGSLLARPKLGAWMVAVLLLVVAGAMNVAGALANDLDEEWPHVVFLFGTTLVVALSAMSRAAHSLASERETGALDMLMATRLTAGDIVRGKYLAVLASVAPFLAFGLLYGLVAAALTDVTFGVVIAWAIGTVTLTAACAAMGLWRSAAASTVSRAVLGTYAIVIGGSILHGLAGGILIVAAGWGMRAEWLVPYVFGPSPVAIAGMGPAVASKRHWGDVDWNVFVAWLLWSVVYWFFSVKLVAWTTNNIARRRDAA